MLPLSGITVVSVEQAVAAPFATRQLADMGARVIKVERPDSGDFARNYDEAVHGMASHFVWLNRSKESVVLDLKSGHGCEALHRLVAIADVFVENLAPGAAARLGFGAEQLRADHPALIHASISGYGSGGPYEQKKAYDLLVQCEAGLVSVTGTADTPSKAGISVADIAAGMYCYTGVLAALVRRYRTGSGATIAVSMLEALAEWMGFPLYYALYGEDSPTRTGASHATIAPYGPFRCAGGKQVFLGVQNEREWRIFCDLVLRLPELADDPRFERNSSRVTHRSELTSHIESAFTEVEAGEVLARLDKAGIANARLREIRDVAEHPQLAARDRWRDVASPVGTLKALLPTGIPDGGEPMMGPIPALGEHTERILAELGLSSPGTEASHPRDA